jgi:predicted RNA-binding Zn-ribbon protein involved in translation (DUF1610 family)
MRRERLVDAETRCRSCGGFVSARSLDCPSCGHPLPERDRRLRRRLVWCGIAGVVVLLLWFVNVVLTDRMRQRNFENKLRHDAQMQEWERQIQESEETLKRIEGGRR